VVWWKEDISLLVYYAHYTPQVEVLLLIVNSSFVILIDYSLKLIGSRVWVFTTSPQSIDIIIIIGLATCDTENRVRGLGVQNQFGG